MMDTSEAPSTSVMPCLPPGGLFEIVFSFDTTGSMSSVADEVKGRLQDMIQRLQADIPGIRIGVIAHGDYCDKEIFYLEKHIDFSNNIVDLCNFLNGVEGTGGGDPEECYEYVLRMTSEFSWTPGSQRALVVIGDATPHEPDYELNIDNLDWRKEAENLTNMGIKIYGVQAFENADSTAFFQELVDITSGHHVKLGEFSHVCDFIMAICYREKGEDFLMDYEAEVRAREGRKKLANDLEGLFGVLRRGDSSASNRSGPSTLRKTGSTSSSAASDHTKGRPWSATPSFSLISSASSASSLSIFPVSKKVPVQPLSSHSSFDSVDLVQALRRKVRNVYPIIRKQSKAVRRKRTNKLVKNIPAIQLRHSVPDTKFILKQNGLAKRWSPWKLAITGDMPKSEKRWVKRTKGHRKNGLKALIGWRKQTLFARETGKIRVLYEIGTQRKRGAKVKVVFSKWGLIGANPENWERRILGNKRLRNFVEDILNNNGKVFVRRFVAKKLGKNQRKCLKVYRRQYKYAWEMS